VNVFFEKLKEKGMFLDEKGFCKEWFVQRLFQIWKGRIKTNHQRA
jgi:hypothetical protein